MPAPTIAPTPMNAAWRTDSAVDPPVEPSSPTTRRPPRRGGAEWTGSLSAPPLGYQRYEPRADPITRGGALGGGPFRDGDGRDPDHLSAAKASAGDLAVITQRCGPRGAQRRGGRDRRWSTWTRHGRRARLASGRSRGGAIAAQRSGAGSNRSGGSSRRLSPSTPICTGPLESIRNCGATIPSSPGTVPHGRSPPGRCSGRPRGRSRSRWRRCRGRRGRGAPACLARQDVELVGVVGDEDDLRRPVRGPVGPGEPEVVRLGIGTDELGQLRQHGPALGVAVLGRLDDPGVDAGRGIVHEPRPLTVATSTRCSTPSPNTSRAPTTSLRSRPRSSPVVPRARGNDDVGDTVAHGGGRDQRL